MPCSIAERVKTSMIFPSESRGSPSPRLLECRALNWAAEASEARVNCWKVWNGQAERLGNGESMVI